MTVSHRWRRKPSRPWFWKKRTAYDTGKASVCAGAVDQRAEVNGHQVEVAEARASSPAAVTYSPSVVRAKRSSRAPAAVRRKRTISRSSPGKTGCASARGCDHRRTAEYSSPERAQLTENDMSESCTRTPSSRKRRVRRG